MQGGFRASYTIVQGSEDSISSIWDNSTRCIAGDCTNYALTSKKKEDFYVAWAKFRWHYAAAKDAGSWDYWVQLTVGKDSASATSS